MIVLDTNVISEPLRPAPDAGVLAWLDAQSADTLYLGSVTLAGLLTGVAALPAGRRRNQLGEALAHKILPLFEGRVLPFDTQAAHAFAAIHRSAAAAGNPIAFADCAIASIAACRGFVLATRNVRHFKGSGVALIDPWETAR